MTIPRPAESQKFFSDTTSTLKGYLDSIPLVVKIIVLTVVTVQCAALAFWVRALLMEERQRSAAAKQKEE